MPSADDDHSLAPRPGVALPCAICGQPIAITNGSGLHVGTRAFPGVWVHTGSCYQQIYQRWKYEFILNQADAYA